MATASGFHVGDIYIYICYLCEPEQAAGREVIRFGLQKPLLSDCSNSDKTKLGFTQSVSELASQRNDQTRASEACDSFFPEQTKV